MKVISKEMRLSVSFQVNTRCLSTNFPICVREVVVIVNKMLKKHYIVVFKKAGAWGCRGGDSLPLYENP